MYLLDTNILIDISRRKLNAAYELLLNSDAGLFKVPAVVKAELLLGAEKSMQPEEERLKVESLLLPFEIIPFDETCAAHYAKIRADLERKGLTIGGNDYLIAATALAHGAPFWSPTTWMSSNVCLGFPLNAGKRSISRRASSSVSVDQGMTLSFRLSSWLRSSSDQDAGAMWP